MKLKIFNTLSSTKEEFIPIKENTVKMYVCGITPYDATHIGHARCYVSFDVIRRFFEYSGYKVIYVQNFTDVDDKTIDRSKQLNISLSELTDRYIQEYFYVMEKLNVKKADYYPKATVHINNMITIISKLLENGFAYKVNGDVYFSVKKFKGYGKLSKKSIEDLITGARVEPDPKKLDPLDFALWKQSKEGEPFWDSPWGDGRPGWHIECSAMSMSYLGETIDIHGGGEDLIFPHHENEIAQSESATGKKFVNYWIHNGFVTINKEKMSKSLGNIFVLKDLFNSFHPMVVRYFLLTQHYRTPLDFSIDHLSQCKNAFNSLKETVNKAKFYIKAKKEKSKSHEDLTDWIDKFKDAYYDDFNFAVVLSILHNLSSSINNSILKTEPVNIVTERLKLFLDFSETLGLKFKEEELEEKFLILIKEREIARSQKDWAKADEIRSYLLQHGIILEDTPFGSFWIKK